MVSPTGAAQGGLLHDLVRQAIITGLPHEPADEPALAALGVQDLLIAYYTWSSRQISARARTVHVSSQLEARRETLAVDVQAGLAAVLDFAHRGIDLRPHLSTGSACGFDATARARPGRRRADVDLLLGSWGLHHLHLSTQLRPGGRAKRTKEVLIAAVRREEFFALDVVPHGAGNDRWWTVRPDLLSIMASNWPAQEFLLRPARSNLTLAQTFTLEEQLQLRQGGVTVLAQTGGAVCLPGGIAIDGTPIASTKRGQETTRLLQECEQRRAELETRARDQAPSLATGPGAAPSWAAEFTAEADLHLLYAGAVRFVVN